MKIGYQGEVGSNAEEAARQMASMLGLDNPEFIPLISSESVASAIRTKRVDFGVMAIKNNIGGAVSETFDAIRDEDFELASACVLEIHHCLFKRKDVDIKEITHVASHIQALKQTRQHREKYFPNLEEFEIEDTAIGARWLSDGTLSANYAVLCKQRAGEDNGLELISANIEDVKPSLTEFRMFKLPSLDYSNTSKPTISDRLLYLIINQSGLGAATKTLLVLAIFGIIYFVGTQFVDGIQLATSLTGAISAIFLFLASKKVSNLLKYRPIKGFWKYYSLADKDRKSNQDMLYETPRIVEIDEVDGELILRGWICDKAAIPFFESEKTIVSSADKVRGSLVYWYRPPTEAGRGVMLGGFADLNWQRKYLASKINSMSGRYYGWATGETGTIRFLRITEEEYEVHKRCEFLGSTRTSHNQTF